MKGKIYNIILILILAAGLSLMLYPTVSNAYNSYLQSLIIADYSSQVDEMEAAAYRTELEAARTYNDALLERSDPFQLPEDLEREYWTRLDTTARGVMAYIEIPSIAVTLPIAHGTDKETLADFVGHIQWSSLPVGGESTHCVISGHRGLPSSELFTNIDHLELGDKFYIHVLGQTLEYRVSNIAVVEPHDYSLLHIDEGKDYYTLVTCTPYGINSHRLLVRGTRISTEPQMDSEDMPVWNEVRSIDLMVVIPVCLAAGIIAVFLIMLITGGKTKKKNGGESHEKT